MALKIGAFLCASASFVGASLIHQRIYEDQEGHLLGVHYDGRLEPTPMPQLGVIVKDYVIGDENCKENCKKRLNRSKSQGSRSGRSRSSGQSHNKEVIIKNPRVNFAQVGDVDRDDPNFAKAPVTIVNIPLVSSVKDTEHKVSANYNKDRSNLPEDKPQNNYEAKTELLSYDNLLKTAVRPVKNVSVELRKVSKSPVIRNSPIKYNVVVPGALEHYTSHQVAVG